MIFLWSCCKKILKPLYSGFEGLGMFSLMTVHRQRVFTSTSPFDEGYVRFLWSLVASRGSICVPRSSKRIASRMLLQGILHIMQTNIPLTTLIVQ